MIDGRCISYILTLMCNVITGFHGLCNDVQLFRIEFSYNIVGYKMWRKNKTSFYLSPCVRDLIQMSEHTSDQDLEKSGVKITVIIVISQVDKAFCDLLTVYF